MDDLFLGYAAYNELMQEIAEEKGYDLQDPDDYAAVLEEANEQW